MFSSGLPAPHGTHAGQESFLESRTIGLRQFSEKLLPCSYKCRGVWEGTHRLPWGRGRREEGLQLSLGTEGWNGEVLSDHHLRSFPFGGLQLPSAHVITLSRLSRRCLCNGQCALRSRAPGCAGASADLRLVHWSVPRPRCSPGRSRVTVSMSAWDNLPGLYRQKPWAGTT